MAQGDLVKNKKKVFKVNPFDIISDFLNFRKQRVGKYSSWTSNEAGVPQGSILGPYFWFLLIISLMT